MEFMGAGASLLAAAARYVYLATLALGKAFYGGNHAP